MAGRFSADSPARIFAFSIFASLAIIVGVFLGQGASALIITLILAVVEVTFSFDNAIINAKVLGRLSSKWQTVFLTLGILVAIFGMRILFPIVIVMLTASLGWSDVLNLALHHPVQYAHHLEQAHASISAFGGAFLLMLALTFFFDDERKIHWIGQLERRLSKLSQWWAAPLAALIILAGFALVPANSHAMVTITSGLLGGATYVLIQTISGLFAKLDKSGEGKSRLPQTGLVALTSLLYLEVLDASFSFDGVIGAFAITSNIVLIAAGLGIGALWVRSLTVFMVRKRMLDSYQYLEHGAHYTVLILALIVLTSIMWDISSYVPGLLGVGVIGASLVASQQVNKRASTLKSRPDHF
jgi:hypothetical protein